MRPRRDGRSAMIECPRCSGTGSIAKQRGVLFVGELTIPKTKTSTCKECGGTGRLSDGSLIAKEGERE